MRDYCDKHGVIQGTYCHYCEQEIEAARVHQWPELNLSTRKPYEQCEYRWSTGELEMGKIIIQYHGNDCLQKAKRFIESLIELENKNAGKTD